MKDILLFLYLKIPLAEFSSSYSAALHHMMSSSHSQKPVFSLNRQRSCGKTVRAQRVLVPPAPSAAAPLSGQGLNCYCWWDRMTAVLWLDAASAHCRCQGIAVCWNVIFYSCHPDPVSHCGFVKTSIRQNSCCCVTTSHLMQNQIQLWKPWKVKHLILNRANNKHFEIGPRFCPQHIIDKY